MKASDISDEAFLAVLDPHGRWTNSGDVAKRLGVPWKVSQAKAQTMITKRGTVHGCYCGCRGDYHLACECKGC